MRLTKTYATDQDAKRVSSRTLLRRGRYPASIKDAVEKPDRHGKPMIELTVIVRDGTDERELRDWLTANDRGAAKLRSCCAACNALDAYDAQEISQELFPGHDLEVDIIIEKRKNFPDTNRIEFYRSISASSVVPLRSAG
jgi:hypothetical protein